MRRFSRLLFALLLTLNLSAHAADACPPNTPTPTPEQLTAAAANARDHGLLWRVSKGGRSAYLYGTVHVGKLDWVLPGPALNKAWEDTDTLAVELDISDAKTIRALTQDAPQLARPLDAPTQARLDAQVRAACLPPQALAALHPLMQVSTLAMLAGRWDELDAGYAQEAMLLTRARAEERRVVALETAQEQLAALIPRDAKDVRRGIDDGLDQLERQQVRAPMLKLAQAWADSDLPLLQRYEQWCDCVHDESDRRYLHGLLEKRNPKMAERFVALHASGRRVLVAVGALHMIGPTGLPALLKKMGFTVERLVPAESP